MPPEKTTPGGDKRWRWLPRRDTASTGYDLALRWGLTLAISVTLGVLGGRWVDQKLSTTPLFILIGLFWGVGGSFLSLYLQVKRMGDREAPPPTDSSSNH